MHSFRNEFFTCLFKIQNVQVIQNDVIKCCKMMSSNVALLHSNNCCVLEPAICEDLDLHVVIFFICPYQTIDGFLEGRIRGFNNKLVVLMTSFTVSVKGHRHLFEGISKKWGKGRLFSGGGPHNVYE